MLLAPPVPPFDPGTAESDGDEPATLAPGLPEGRFDGFAVAESDPGRSVVRGVAAGAGVGFGLGVIFGVGVGVGFGVAVGPGVGSSRSPSWRGFEATSENNTCVSYFWRPGGDGGNGGWTTEVAESAELFWLDR
jgi:hypothetical protein